MGAKFDAIPGVIDYLSVTFHQNGIIREECAQICGISGTYTIFCKVVAYFDYLIDKIL